MSVPASPVRRLRRTRGLLRLVARLVRVARWLAAAAALARLAGAATRRPPLTAAGLSDASPPGDAGPGPGISVVVPARDEAQRIGPLLDAVVGAPGVREVLVVDDESTDATAAVAIAAGATVVPGTPRPYGWAGKAWALEQGIRRARGEWVVTLDADTRPDPRLPLALVRRAEADGLQFVSVGPRFDCPTPGSRWLHPAMLTTLVYRYGPAGAAAPVAPHRQLANGQCTAVRREPFQAAGGMLPVAGQVVEDVALARHLAALGWRVALLDGADVLTTRMYDDLPATFTGWSRSLALPGVEPPWRQAVDAWTVLAAQVLPLPRLLARRGDLLDVVLLAARLGTLAGTARAYQRRGAAYWLSPLADPVAAVALVIGACRRHQTWRGREYATPPSPPAGTAGR